MQIPICILIKDSTHEVWNKAVHFYNKNEKGTVIVKK